MRILCVSDQIDPIVYSVAIRERFRDVDLVLSAGDLPMEYLSFLVSSLNRPLLFVFGNHNINELGIYRPHSAAQRHFSALRWPSPDIEGGSGAIYAGFRVIQENGLLILGLGGSMRYNGGANQYTNSQMMLRILLLVPRLFWNRMIYGRFIDIVLTHAPPEGIQDRPDPCHRGFKPFLWLMRAFQPKLLVHGHIHLYDLNSLRVSTYKNTTVVNAFNHYLFDWEDFS